MAQIDRRTFTPLYYRVEQELLRQIQRGQYQFGGQLPSESQNSRDFGVSRIPVNSISQSSGGGACPAGAALLL